MPYLRLAAAQLNTVVGDLAGNVDRILAALSAAEAAGRRHLHRARAGHPGLPARGPPPQAGLRGRQRGRAGEGGRGHAGSAPSWSATSGPTPTGTGLSNAAAICAGGRVVGIYRKRFLPNYGVFDEQRWFVSEQRDADPVRGGRGLGRASRSARTCGSPTGRWPQQGRAGADVVVNLNASPYNRGRRARAAGHAAAGGWPRPGAPSPTSTRSAGRTSWSSTATRSIVAADGTLLASGAQFATGPGGGGHPHRRRRGPARAARPKLPRVVATEPRAGAGGRAVPPPAASRPAARAVRRSRGLCRPRARDPRLPGQERVHRGGDRPVGRHRLVAGGHHRRRCAGARPTCTGSPCRRAIRATAPATTPRPWPRCSASTCGWCRLRRRTSPSPPCWPACSAASRPA